jgi:hypothetical protein
MWWEIVLHRPLSVQWLLYDQMLQELHKKYQRALTLSQFNGMPQLMMEVHLSLITLSIGMRDQAVHLASYLYPVEVCPLQPLFQPED